MSVIIAGIDCTKKQFYLFRKIRPINTSYCHTN